MPTIAATIDAVLSQVRLDLDFTDLDSPYVLVNRVDPATGATTAVRSHGGSASVGTVAYTPLQAGYATVLYDTEMPMDANFYYVATAPSGTLNVNSTFSGGFYDPWHATSAAVTIRIIADAAGKNYLTFFTGGATANPTLYAEDIPATAGASLTITATMSANVSQGVTLGFNCLDSTGAILSTVSTSATVLAATSVTATGTTPANTVAVRPLMTMSGTPAATTVVSVNPVTVTTVAGTAATQNVSVPSHEACQFKDPLRPGNNVRVDFTFDPNPLCVPAEGVFWQSLDVESQAANAAVLNVNNQANPLVVSKVRSSPTSTLTLVSRTFADRDRLIALLAPGSPLLFQAPNEFGLPDRYISVGADTISRVLPDHRIPIRVFSLPHAVVSAPGGPMQGVVGARWSDVCSTWATVASSTYTWLEVLDGLAS